VRIGPRRFDQLIGSIRKRMGAFYHSAITPVIVDPGHRHAIAPRPEFIVPQDGDEKQDCETAAAKRWLDKEAAR